MTDLGELEDEFPAQTILRARGRHPAEFCGGGHRWTPETTRWYVVHGRRRRLCRICDNERRKPKCT